MCGTRADVRRVPDHPARTTCSSLVASTERWYRCRAARYGRRWPGCGRQIDIHCEAAFGERLRPRRDLRGLWPPPRRSTTRGRNRRRRGRARRPTGGSVRTARQRVRSQHGRRCSRRAAERGSRRCACRARSIRDPGCAGRRCRRGLPPIVRGALDLPSTRAGSSSRSRPNCRARPPRVRLVRQRNAPWPRDHTARRPGLRRRCASTSKLSMRSSLRCVASRTSSAIARNSSGVASGSASVTSTSARMMASGVRSSCDASATKRRWPSKADSNAGQHRVECVGELLELVVGTVERDPLVEV